MPGRGAEVPLETVLKDLQALKKALDAGTDPRHPASLILVLGATTQEAGRFPVERVEGSPLTKWIFLSSEAHAPSSDLHVRCDFNDADQLFRVSRILAHKVSAIIPDWSVMKFTRWKAGHWFNLRNMLKEGGTFFLPVETWGAIHPGINLDGTLDPEENKGPTGNRTLDSRRYAELIQRAMSNAERQELRDSPVPLLLPSTLHVPLVWVRLDAATQTQALAVWKSTYLIPALERRMRETVKFRSVNLVRFTPTFLKGRPEIGAGLEYLACKP
jgi:hypothetical protein